MSSLKERLREKSRELIKRETVTLPETGETVVVRGLTFGENERVGTAREEKRGLMMVAVAVEDPETGKPIWNPNDVGDMQALGELPLADMQAVVKAIDRLSAGNRSASGKTGSSPTPSSGSGSEAAPSPSSKSE